jgi:hypothetical protein
MIGWLVGWSFERFYCLNIIKISRIPFGGVLRNRRRVL